VPETHVAELTATSAMHVPRCTSRCRDWIFLETCARGAVRGAQICCRIQTGGRARPSACVITALQEKKRRQSPLGDSQVTQAWVRARRDADFSPAQLALQVLPRSLAGYAWHLKHKPDSNAGIPEYRGPSARLSDLDNSAPIDVCIVGSGPAGRVLGTELARAGVRTLIVEAGINPSAMSPESSYAQLNVATQSGDLPYPLTATRAMSPGGTTSLWTGNTPRLLPLDFERNAFTPAGAGWPITYREVDPFYELAEQTLQVVGESNVRFLPKRRRPLPPTSGSNQLTKSLLASIDIASYDTFRSRAKFGGPVRAARDLLPVFSRESTAIFLPGVIARGVMADGSKWIASAASPSGNAADGPEGTR